MRARGPASRIAAAGAFWSMLLLVGGGWAPVASAQVVVAGHETTGTGATEREAIGNALQQAAFQLCGVRVQSEAASSLSQVASGDDVEIVEDINQRISVTAGRDTCRLQGYDVLDAARADDGVRVRIAVRHATYRTPGPAVDRRRLAVLDFPMGEVLHADDGDAEADGNGDPYLRALQERFRARIEALLTQGRRFAVLDRRAAGIYEQEKQLLQSADVDPAEAARLGSVLGADYLLYGAIDRLAVEEQRTEIQLTGESRVRVSAAARVRFSVLAVATRQVKWSSSIALEQEAAEQLPPEQLAEALLDAVAGSLVDELTENIYPPAVAQIVAPGSFVVNRGGATVRAGELFELFATGPPIVDPDTGESLGALEIAVGIARITDVKPKYSLAEMVHGTAEVAQGMVLRRYRSGPAAPAAGRRTADGDGDGLPDYLDRVGSTGDRDRDGLPDYLNRYHLRRR